jgi:hypothetical protein
VALPSADSIRAYPKTLDDNDKARPCGNENRRALQVFGSLHQEDKDPTI